MHHINWFDNEFRFSQAIELLRYAASTMFLGRTRPTPRSPGQSRVNLIKQSVRNRFLLGLIP